MKSEKRINQRINDLKKLEELAKKDFYDWTRLPIVRIKIKLLQWVLSDD